MVCVDVHCRLLHISFDDTKMCVSIRRVTNFGVEFSLWFVRSKLVRDTSFTQGFFSKDETKYRSYALLIVLISLTTSQLSIIIFFSSHRPTKTKVTRDDFR